VTSRPRVLIAGAGVAGLEALLALRALVGDGVEITIVAPETKFINDSMAVTRPSTPPRIHAVPLEVFGGPASAAIRGLLDDRGIALHTSRQGVPSRPGRLHISPGDRRLPVDRIVTLPRLVGPRPCGVPCGRDGFIDTDVHGRVRELDDVFAAGDATAFPIKQGGLAAQQADAVAEAIAASLGADIAPQPFRPVLRGALVTGGATRYLRAAVSGSDDEASVSDEALWWPPNRLCARYLAPYLSSQVGFAADVMPQGKSSVVVEAAVDARAPRGWGAFAELRDLPSR
jgi:NADH dehydrogenase FAD-containing subunit